MSHTQRQDPPPKGRPRNTEIGITPGTNPPRKGNSNSNNNRNKP